MGISHKFDFGTGEAAEGYAKVHADTGYTKERGYGFMPGGVVSARSRKDQPELRRDFCIPLDAVFAVELPDGVYQVTAVTGDGIAAADTTIKANGGRLMVNRLRTSPGQFAVTVFSVWVSGGRLTLAFSGLTPRINALEIASSDQIRTIFLAGDSTVTDQQADGFPYAGWGQMLPALIKADAAVANFALSGRSSKSFIAEGQLEQIWALIKPHDYLLIQFGHNDQKLDDERHTDPFTTYKATLKQYIDGARQRQAIPILVTPVHRRFFDGEGRLLDTHGDYLTAMKELAASEDTPLIDLAARSKALFEELGPEETKAVFMWTLPGEFANFPNGTEDNTHFQEQGGIRIAGLVAEGLKDLQLNPLMLYVR